MRGLYFRTILAAGPVLLSGCSGGSPDKTAAADRPNILIAMGDDISFPHMGAYGTKWVKTPGFDRVASDGILFGNAYTPNAKSSPSRACFLTGRYSWQLEEAANHVPYFPSRFKSFMEALSDNGYVTGHVQKGWAPGVALDSSGNPRLLTGKAFNSRRLTPPTSGISANDYSGNFEEFLNSITDESPFCFWYGSVEPHRAYEYGSGIAKGGKKIEEITDVYDFWPDHDMVKTDILDYAYEIEYFDNHLVRMINLLEEKGELDNTIIIVTADNGMPFPRVKGQVYEFSNHLPLAIMWGKGIKNPGRVIYDYISFIDFAPTLLEAAGILQSESGMQPIEGKSFTDVFRSRKNSVVDKNRNYVLLGKERHDVGRPNDEGYPVRGILKNGFLLLKNYKSGRFPAGNPETGYLNCDGGPTKSLILNMRRTGKNYDYWKLNFGMRSEDELYDLGKDPDCMNNLATDAGYNTARLRLYEQLYDELLAQEDPRILGNGDIFDRYPYAQKNNADFYNRYMRGELSRKSAEWVDSTDFEESRQIRK